MGKNEPMENLERRKFASPVFQRPKHWGVSNLKFFHTIDINKMAAIFQLFHNGRC